MRVLAGADDDGVELARVVKEGAEIADAPRLGKAFRGGVQSAGTHVAQGNNVLALDGLQVAAAPAADTDDGDIQSVGRVLGPQEAGRCREDTGGDELTAREQMTRHRFPPLCWSANPA